jgi:hypothetical protein
VDRLFRKFAEDAAQIGPTGRWSSVNAAIEQLVRKPPPGNEWYVQLLGGLCFQVFTQYLLLKAAYETSGDSPYVAWRARNLLERTLRRPPPKTSRLRLAYYTLRLSLRAPGDL